MSIGNDLELINKYLSNTLGISEIKYNDSYVIRGACGLFMITIKRGCGNIEMVRGIIPNGKSFESITIFYPERLSIETRRDYVRKLRLSGETEQQIADWLGVSQPTIHKDLQKIRQD